jgi:hypothetical protein
MEQDLEMKETPDLTKIWRRRKPQILQRFGDEGNLKSYKDLEMKKIPDLTKIWR